jgi:hypothetical protein
MYLQKVGNKQKNFEKTNFCFVGILSALTKRAGSESGSVNQWYGSTDPQHCLKDKIK